MSLAKEFICTVVLLVLLFHCTWGNGRVVPEMNSESKPNTIKTLHGDIYECVDFYEQPAFKHPLLRNHTFHPEIKPSITPTRIEGYAKTKDAKPSLLFGLENGGCPLGTVPIRRLTQQSDQTRSRTTQLSIEQLYSNPNAVPVAPGVQYAISQTKATPVPQQYYGVGADFSILNPDVEGNQFSSAQCAIKNGADAIEFGWTVNPTLYHDQQTRLYIRTDVGDTHCFNTECGFVIVRTDIPMGSILNKYSNATDLYVITMTVYRESESGNWWLTVNDDHTKVGFWPSRIMGSLGAYGTYIECGGKAYSSNDQLPEIGKGKIPVGTLYADAFVENFVTVNDKLHIVDAIDTEKFVTNGKYRVTDWGVVKKLGHTLLFGGPRYN